MMLSSWSRRRITGRKPFKGAAVAEHHGLLQSNLESELNLLNIPSHFRCPISLDLMKDPVTLSTGITYDRESIEKWIEAGNDTCPATNQPLTTTIDQIPNHALRRMIQDWCVQNRPHGVERIPTPRIPVTPRDVSEICKKITAATQRGDQRKCFELVVKIKSWDRESERNKRCIVENGAGFVLSACFESFAATAASNNTSDENECLLGETLSALTWMFPLGEEGQSKLGSPSSLRCMARFLEAGEQRQNAVLALRQLLALDKKHVDAFAGIGGVDEALMKIMIKHQISPAATKAALMVIYYMISPPTSTASEKISSRFVELGIVSSLLEILVGGDKSVSEKALAVFDGICSWKEGAEKARRHALTMPVLVKKILRVSEPATEFSVSALRKLCMRSTREDGGGDGEEVGEALQLGAFQKLLVVLQVGCGDKTKEKATELLKLMNQYRSRLGCFDSSVDFKYMKRT